MPIEQPIILYPVRFTATSYVLRVTQNSVTEDLPFPASGSLTIDRNYWFSGEDDLDIDGGEGGIGDILRMLETTLAEHSVGGVWSVTFNANRQIQIANASYAFSILWSHANSTLPEHIFGAPNATSTSSGNAVTLGKPPHGHWIPGQPAETDSRDQPRILTGVATSLGGETYRRRLVEGRKARTLAWNLLPQSRVLEESGDMATVANTDATQTDTLEYLWRGAITHGYPIRYYPDRGETDYTLYSVQNIEEPWQRDAQYLLRWSCSLDLRRVTT